MSRVIYKQRGLKVHPPLGLGLFIPVFDTTDHMHFACVKCKEIANVLMVERSDSYANTPTLYFFLKCPKCESMGFRKIYLEDGGKHFLAFPKIVELLARNAEEAKPGIIRRVS